MFVVFTSCHPDFVMEMCMGDSEAELARQVDRQINDELERTRQQMVIQIYHDIA